MHNRKKRVLWLLNHVTLMKTEVPILLEMGFEVFTPKIIPSGAAFRSGAVDFSFDDHLTLPKHVLDALNSADLYGQDWPDDVVQYMNDYFSIAFIMPMKVPLKNALLRFGGAILLRAFGQEKEKRYADVIEYYSRYALRWVYAVRDRFWVASGYEQLREVEPPLLSERDIHLPIALPSTFDVHKDTWVGGRKQILFVCPSIESSELYKSAYLEFKQNFGDLPHVIVGKQNIPVNDEHVLGFVSDDELRELTRECAVMYYHSHEPRHVHYHPIEASVVGMPVIFYDDNLLARMLKKPIIGAVSSHAEARRMIEAILNDDQSMIDRVRHEQGIIHQLFSEAHCLSAWKENFENSGLSDFIQNNSPNHADSPTHLGRVPPNLLVRPNVPSDTSRTLDQGIDFKSPNYSHLVQFIDGLSYPESWGRWSDGSLIEIELTRKLAGNITLNITGGAYGENLGAPLKIAMGDAESNFTFNSEPWQPETRSVSLTVRRPTNRIIIKVPHPLEPAGDTDRSIGIGIANISIIQEGSGKPLKLEYRRGNKVYEIDYAYPILPRPPVSR